ncbi:MAG: hypothetical protein ACRENB_09305 [Gemmatimonadales bacterium]
MMKLTLTLALAMLPGALLAQQSASDPAGSAGATARVTAEARAEARIPSGFSAETRARLEAMVRAAERQGLPSEPMTDRMAEGRAKGASDAAILGAAARSRTELEASLQALRRGGRERPDREEIARGAQVIARGATEAEVEALVRRTPSERRLTVAFEVLTDLTARGVPVDRALAVVGARLEAGATDSQLSGLAVSAAATANANAGVGLDRSAGTVTKTLTGSVGVGIRKP